MFNQFVNKKCDILVSFASSGIDRGASPTCYFGTVLSVDNDFVAVDVEYIGEPNSYKKHKTVQNFLGYTIISTKYIIAIRESTQE